jgi:hypothetical protein
MLSEAFRSCRSPSRIIQGCNTYIRTVPESIMARANLAVPSRLLAVILLFAVFSAGMVVQREAMGQVAV